MKKILLILVLVIVGLFVYKNYYTPKVISENYYPVLSCSDTDGKDIYVKGYTNYERDEPGESNRYESPDTCESHPKAKKDVLREGWCEANVYKEIRTTCGYGRSCVDGACI
ncbi:MAG: hypothetical protein AAB455_02145 [Patescibacteria group bacterium]